MKINNSILTSQYIYNPSFKANENEWNVFGIDEAGLPKRDYIRQWHDEHYMPYQSIYENEGRMSEYQLNTLMSGLIRKPVPVNNEKLKKLGLVNLEQIGKRFYRGAMLFCRNFEKVSGLKDAGIRTIVDLVGGTNLEEECIKNDIKYFHLNMDCTGDAYTTESNIRRMYERIFRDIANLDEMEIQKILNEKVEIWKARTSNHIEKFIKFINIMQHDNVYIGCELGIYRTNIALFFDYLFNPKRHNVYEPESIRKSLIQSAKNLYYNLTDSDKIKMGWTKAFDEQFLPKLKKMKSK